MEPIKAARNDDSIAPAGGGWNQTMTEESENPAATRAELDRLRKREAEIMSLIGCRSPEKILHDLRNVLNELQLLRMLSETDKA